jgi:hypothetical protein
MSNFQLNRELKGLQSDRESYKNDLKNQQEKYAYFLRNELGEDIDNVLNGKVKVKLSFKEKLKYFIDKIFNSF